jgi:hypothetical protein
LESSPDYHSTFDAWLKKYPLLQKQPKAKMARSRFSFFFHLIPFFLGDEFHRQGVYAMAGILLRKALPDKHMPQVAAAIVT